MDDLSPAGIDSAFKAVAVFLKKRFAGVAVPLIKGSIKIERLAIGEQPGTMQSYALAIAAYGKATANDPAAIKLSIVIILLTH